MKIKEIIKNAAIILGLSDVVEVIQSGTKTQRLNNINFRVLLRASNLVVANLAANFTELTQKVEINFTDGRIQLSDFPSPFVRIIRVRELGRDIDFRLFIDHVALTSRQGSGIVEVEYAYLPTVKDGEECNPFPLPAAALEYGILSEYAFISGMFNEAQVWRAKLAELLFATKRKDGRSITMPQGLRG